MKCETVKVVSPVSPENPHGYIVINRTDLTDDHKVFGAEPEADKTPVAKRKYTKQTDK